MPAGSRRTLRGESSGVAGAGPEAGPGARPSSPGGSGSGSGSGAERDRRTGEAPGARREGPAGPPLPVCPGSSARCPGHCCMQR
ncbi:voltage-dependent calcium channel gamma-8 subunit-like [Vulpes lagopus]|uniref:voltage-dependent calcium channel gamma-8 subunit-like n=1 Tax=Vulpes lagopus TaxID=494514 RepID=UPI001BC9E8D4|nr:voltage-dependent calcium channel gamma-8 subunit-like [Vulpes lagopus]